MCRKPRNIDAIRRAVAGSKLSRKREYRLQICFLRQSLWEGLGETGSMKQEERREKREEQRDSHDEDRLTIRAVLQRCDVGIAG